MKTLLYLFGAGLWIIGVGVIPSITINGGVHPVAGAISAIYLVLGGCAVCAYAERMGRSHKRKG